MPETERWLPITLRSRGAVPDRRALRLLLARCLDSEGAEPKVGVGLLLAGDRLVRRLNRDFRGKDRVTDVLSFNLEGGPPLPGTAGEKDSALLGEVVISLPRCRAQAREREVDSGVELVRLVVHGVLHLLGHDHERPADRARMLPRERRLRAWAKAHGIGPGLLGSSSGRNRRPLSARSRRVD